MKRPNRIEQVAIENLVQWLNFITPETAYGLDFSSQRGETVVATEEEIESRTYKFIEDWEAFKSSIDPFDFAVIAKVINSLLKSWSPCVRLTLSQPLSIYKAASTLSREEFRKLQRHPDRLKELKLMDAHIVSLLSAIPYLQPEIVRKCKKERCPTFLVGWDRRDYCSKKCRPKLNRAEYQKVLMQAKRLAEVGKPAELIKRMMEKDPPEGYGKEFVSKYYNSNWSFLKKKGRNHGKIGQG